MSRLKFVFCEGGDDLAVAQGVAASIGLSELQIEPFLGKNKLQQFLKGIQVRPEFVQKRVASIGIIRDADEDGSAAFQSVCDALRGSGFKTPHQNGGFTTNGMRIGVLIVGPDNGCGMIEDLCLRSVSNRPEFPCLEEYFRCIAAKCDRKHFSSKARIRVWMASHVDYEYYVGKAAEEGYWPWESPVFDPLKKFLSEL